MQSPRGQVGCHRIPHFIFHFAPVFRGLRYRYFLSIGRNKKSRPCLPSKYFYAVLEYFVGIPSSYSSLIKSWSESIQMVVVRCRKSRGVDDQLQSLSCMLFRILFPVFPYPYYQRSNDPANDISRNELFISTVNVCPESKNQLGAGGDCWTWAFG